MKVLLVANYISDGQESMLRFSRVLATGFEHAGLTVEVIRPVPLVGRLKPAGTGLGKWLGYIDKFLLFPSELRRRARGADVVHICDHSNAMYVAHLGGTPSVVTCNDMLAIRSARGEINENRTGVTGRMLQRWILRSLSRAGRLVCISEATRQDVLRLTKRDPCAVSLTYMGLNYPYAPVHEVAHAREARSRGEAFDSSVFPRFEVPSRPYILHVGGTQWYKNRHGVLGMYDALKARLGPATPHLVIVGRPGIAHRDVEQRSGVDNKELAALYSGAELMIFPSLEEGFGWPIVEAQACGCPVLTTRRAPMTEVAGDAARYLNDPKDLEGGADAISRLLRIDREQRHEITRQGMINAKRFGTERMIEQYVAVYQDLCCA